MKEGLKKFLGVMTVYSILGGSAGIGASAFYSSNLAGVAGFDICSFNDALVTSVPGMTDEEVKAMNLCADFLLLVVEITHADYYEELEKLPTALYDLANTHINDIGAFNDSNFIPFVEEDVEPEQGVYIPPRPPKRIHNPDGTIKTEE